MAVRAGHLPGNHVVYASHLGDPVARTLEPAPRVMVDCPTCRWRREERIRRTRERGPTPLRETPKHCLKCYGSERVLLERGLIKFVQEVEDVPHRLLAAWATDCAEHQLERLSPRNALAFEGRYRLPSQPLRDPDLEVYILPAVREWLKTGQICPVIYQRAATNARPDTSIGVPGSLATIVALAGIEEQERQVRFRAASVASDAYHAAGGTRAERDWQEQRLIKYLLGYLG